MVTTTSGGGTTSKEASFYSELIAAVGAGGAKKKQALEDYPSDNRDLACTHPSDICPLTLINSPYQFSSMGDPSQYGTYVNFQASATTSGAGVRRNDDQDKKDDDGGASRKKIVNVTGFPLHGFGLHMDTVTRTIDVPTKDEEKKGMAALGLSPEEMYDSEQNRMRCISATRTMNETVKDLRTLQNLVIDKFDLSHVPTTNDDDDDDDDDDEEGNYQDKSLMGFVSTLKSLSRRHVERMRTYAETSARLREDGTKTEEEEDDGGKEDEEDDSRGFYHPEYFHYIEDKLLDSYFGCNLLLSYDDHIAQCHPTSQWCINEETLPLSMGKSDDDDAVDDGALHPDVAAVGMGLYYGILLGLGSMISSLEGMLPRRVRGVTAVLWEVVKMDLAGRRNLIPHAGNRSGRVVEKSPDWGITTPEKGVHDHGDDDEEEERHDLLSNWIVPCHTKEERHEVFRLALTIENDLWKRCRRLHSPGDGSHVYDTAVRHEYELEEYVRIYVLCMGGGIGDSPDAVRERAVMDGGLDGIVWACFLGMNGGNPDDDPEVTKLKSAIMEQVLSAVCNPGGPGFVANSKSDASGGRGERGGGAVPPTPLPSTPPSGGGGGHRRGDSAVAEGAVPPPSAGGGVSRRDGGAVAKGAVPTTPDGGGGGRRDSDAVAAAGGGGGVDLTAATASPIREPLHDIIGGAVQDIAGGSVVPSTPPPLLHRESSVASSTGTGGGKSGRSKRKKRNKRRKKSQTSQSAPLPQSQPEAAQAQDSADEDEGEEGYDVTVDSGAPPPPPPLAASLSATRSPPPSPARDPAEAEYTKQHRRWIGLSERLSRHRQREVLSSLKRLRTEYSSTLKVASQWQTMSNRLLSHRCATGLQSVFVELVSRRNEAARIVTRSLQRLHLRSRLKTLISTEPCAGPDSVLRYYVNRRLGLDSQDVFHGVITTKNLLEGTTESTHCAVKKLRRSEVAGRGADNEINVMKRAIEKDWHRNVLRILAVERGPEYIYLGLELCHGSLSDADFFGHGKFSPEERLELCTQMISGIEHLHGIGIFHRDIKPANMLYIRSPVDGRYTIKVADMGIAKSVNLDMTSHLITKKAVGTESYMPAELYDEDFLSQKNGRWSEADLVASDVFSLGCVLHFVITEGWHPWGMNEAGRKIRPNRIAFAIEDREEPNLTVLSKMKIRGGRAADATHLVGKMVSHDRTQRGTASMAKSHPVFWTPAAKIQYMERCFRRVDFVEKVGNSGGESGQYAVFPKDGDWRRRVAKVWDSNIGSFQAPPPPAAGGVDGKKAKAANTFYNKSLFDFVRFVRNLTVHFQEYSRANHPIIGLLSEEHEQWKRQEEGKRESAGRPSRGGVEGNERLQRNVSTSSTASTPSFEEDLQLQEHLMGEYFFSHVDTAITAIYDIYGTNE